MRLPRSRGNSAVRQIIRQRSSPYDLQRRTDESKESRFGEDVGGRKTITNVDIWLYAPNEINIDVDQGERLTGDLHGLALEGTDVEVEDTLTHGGETYEVETVEAVPDASETEYVRLSLDKRTNEGTP